MRSFNLSGFGFATEKMVDRIIWPIFLFLTIGSIKVFGGIVSIGLIAGVITTYLVGFLSDFGRRRLVLRWSAVTLSFLWIIRTVLLTPIFIAGSHVAGSIIKDALMVAWSSQYYKIARSVEEPSAFILSREILYNLSRVFFLPILMLLSYLLALNQLFIVSFITAAVLSIFYLFANKFHTSSLIQSS